MPNYIKELESKTRMATLKEDEAKDRITAFQAFLQTSEKFKGFNADGSPKDVINIKDVLSYLQQIKTPLNWASWDEINDAMA